MRKILLLIFLFISVMSYSQVKQVYPQYGGTWKKLYLIDSGAFRLPIKIASTKDFNLTTPDSGQVYYDPVDSSIKVWTGTQWRASSGGGGVSPTRAINTGYGLTGGGDLSIDRTHVFDSATVFPQLRATIPSGASFTEVSTEFTGSTSMSITLSNTPISGKAEMYFLNGVLIEQANISRTGTSVTLSGFTRQTNDIITAKYSY